MQFKVIETTDGKHEGQRIEMVLIPNIGFDFLLEDISFEIAKKVETARHMVISGTSYSITLKKIK